MMLYHRADKDSDTARSSESFQQRIILEGNDATLLVRNAEILVTMDDRRREIKDGGLFIRDGFIRPGR